MTSLLQLFANGIVFGSIALLGAVGLSLLYGIGNFANFAHGELLTLGAYITFAGHVQFGLPLIVAGLLAIAVTAVVGVVLDRTLMMKHRDSPAIVVLIVTIGVTLLLRSIVRIVWTSELRSLQQGLSEGIQLVETTIPIASYDLVLNLRLTADSIAIFVLGVLLAVVTHLFLTRTRIGVAMRATADNKSLARVVGVDTDMVLTVTWALSAGLAAIGGIFLAVESGVILPRMGFKVLLMVFAAVILGGIGSPYGAMIGAYVVGVAQEMSVALPFIEPGYRFAVSFVIMIVVLLYRPTGIAGGEW
jgi:branched-subunit amino acid ABC-type transport system permease component